MALLNAPEKGPKLSSSIETGKLIVQQPAKMRELNDLLLTFEAIPGRVSEVTGEDRSGDMGGGGGAAGQTQGSRQISPRDLAIKNMPAEEIIQKQLKQHIEQEIHELSTMARKITKSNRPGSAHQLNQLYARMRRLNQLLADILAATGEILKRLYVRVFVDKQPVL